MANDYGALGSAIYTLVDGVTSLPVYGERAPQGTVPQYVIFTLQDLQDEHTFNSHGITADYVIKVVSSHYWPGSAIAQYDAIHNAIENGGSIAGYQLLRMQRQSSILYQEPAGFWHVGGLYQVEGWEA